MKEWIQCYMSGDNISYCSGLLSMAASLCPRFDIPITQSVLIDFPIPIAT